MQITNTGAPETPGTGVDEGMMTVGKEMARVALVAARRRGRLPVRAAGVA